MAPPAEGAVFFWRETETPYGFLSQWYDCPFTVEGETYASTEMWMMVQKARLFKDEIREREMLDTTDPHTHRTLGRKVVGYDNRTWNQHKSRIVEEGNWHKFVDKELREQLLATGDRELVEASPYDRIWGVGFKAKDAEAKRAQWGENLLGKAIMKVRDRIRAEQDGQTVEEK